METIADLDDQPVLIEYEYEPAETEKGGIRPVHNEVFNVTGIWTVDDKGKVIADMTENFKPEVFEYFENQLLAREI